MSLNSNLCITAVSRLVLVKVEENVQIAQPATDVPLLTRQFVCSLYFRAQCVLLGRLADAMPFLLTSL